MNTVGQCCGTMHNAAHSAVYCSRCDIDLRTTIVLLEELEYAVRQGQDTSALKAALLEIALRPMDTQKCDLPASHSFVLGGCSGLPN